MRITVEIPDELAVRARARGLTPEAYVLGLIEEAAVEAETPKVDPSEPKMDMETFLRKMSQNSEKIPQLPDEAFTRESFYQDHD
jgi:hypothetical protein